MCRLNTRSYKSRVADDVPNLALRLKSPFTLVGVGERNVPVLTPKDDDRVMVLVNNLASQILRLDPSAKAQLHGLERTGGTDWWFLLAPTLREDSLGPGLGALVAEDDADLSSVGAGLLESSVGVDLLESIVHAALLECRIADNMMDFGLLAESPGALVAVAEGDIYVGAAEHDDGLVGGVEDLAAVVLVLDALAELEFDGLEGSELRG